MISLQQILKGGPRIPQDLTVVHLGAAGVCCARLRHAGEQTLLLGADLLPPAVFDQNAPETVKPLALPKALQARYVAICLSCEDAVIKLLNLPGQMGEETESLVRENMGLGDGDYRIGYRLVSQGRHGRAETKLLTVAVPELAAQACCRLFPVGIPAPISIEVAGMAAMTAFASEPARQQEDYAVGCIMCDEQESFLAFFLKGELLLIRKFNFGHHDLLALIQQKLGVDHKTARDILADGSFDVSQIVKKAMEPFVKQLVISKHFIERRENCRLARIFVSRGDCVARDWMNEVRHGMGVEPEVWDPLGLVQLPSEPLSASLPQMHAFSLSAVIGAALGLFAEKKS
ncbi:MAG: hypothetical protein ABR497_09215 [Kiritimatiellia bacterium]